MTLGVKIIDKLTKKTLNENDEGNLIFGVLMDDTVSVIKHKMFVGLGIMYYPNLIKLEIKINDNYIILDDDNCLLFYYENYPDESIIYVTNLISIINENEYSDIKLEPYYLYTTVIKQDNNIINNLFELLVKEFTDLTKEDLINVIKMKILYFSNQNSNLTLFNRSDLDYFTEDRRNFTTTLNSELKKSSVLYETEKYMKDFYKKAYEITDYSEFYETNKDKSPLFTYISIIYNIKGYSNISEIDKINKIIKLDKIFNILELSEKIPFIVYSGGEENGKKTPKVKIYNKLISDVSDTVIKSWVLNEKKKMNQMTYKKIKGLMIKYKLDMLKTKKIENLFMTLIINEDGLIIVKLNFVQDDNKTSIEDITEMVKKGVDDIINIITHLDGIYYNSERLMLTKDSKVSINSINVVLGTNVLINKNTFRSMLTQHGISNIFELKETKDETKLSMYYKNFGKRETDDIDLDKKGITVTIQNNDFKLNASIISIYSGYSINQITTIANEISIIYALIKDKVIKSTSILEEDEIEEQKDIKETSNIKKLKESVQVSSVKCQKQRQPRELSLNENDSKKFLEKNKKSIISYEGKQFICPNTDYPYPGFTKDNILCCFKKEGRGITQNLENPYILETIVQPSNFIITVSEINNNVEKKFDTYVIKVISDINEELGSPYFYISNKSEFPLIHIDNKDLVKKIEDTENNAPDGNSIWLNPVALSQLLTKPNKSTCVNQPNLDIKNESGSVNINAPCKHHSQNTIFGYNINAYPCCFDNTRNIYNSIKTKGKDPTKMHILTTDKPAVKQHLGDLQPGLKELFELINKNKSSKFYRWGVNQNNLAFLNCVLEGIEYKMGDLSIGNTIELRRVLINYLEKTPEDFNKLNSGNIISKYISLQNYINAISDNINVIHWVDIVDLIQRALSFNILVIDIPYLESGKNPDYNNTKIVCNLSVKYDYTKPFMIFIKKKKTFEIVVEIEKQSSKKTPLLRFVFDYKKSDIINFFLNYYKNSCVKDDEYPDTFNYQTSYEISNIINILNGTNHEILCQLVNSFNKVNLVVTKTGIIIPVKETGILDLPFVLFDKFIEKDKPIDILKYKRELDSINKILPKDKQMSILGITTKTDDTGKYYTGILTNFGQIIPIKNTKVDDNILQNLETDYPYYPDVDKYISNTLNVRYGDKENVIVSNIEVEWNNQLNNKKDYIFEIKKKLGKDISENDKNKIISIVKDTKMSKIKKINQIKNIFNEYLKGTEYEDLDFILSHISNEVINDNIQNLLLNNLVTSEMYNPKEIIKRDNESILLNINDIRKWITKFSIDE